MLFITFINATVTLGKNEENYCNHVQWTWNLLVFNWLLQIQGHGLQSPTASRYLQSNFDTSRQQKNSIKTEPMWHHFVIEWGHLHYWVQIHMKPKLIREITRDKKQKFRNFCTNSDIIVPNNIGTQQSFLNLGIKLEFNQLPTTTQIADEFCSSMQIDFNMLAVCRHL